MMRSRYIVLIAVAAGLGLAVPSEAQTPPPAGSPNSGRLGHGRVSDTPGPPRAKPAALSPFNVIGQARAVTKKVGNVLVPPPRTRDHRTK